MTGAPSRARSRSSRTGRRTGGDRRRVYGSTGRAASVGVTEPTGVGKSSLVSALVGHARGLGRSIGVVSVDPSSPFTQGALLGDRIRLADHFLDPDVYIRSMGTRGHLGGLAEATLQTLLLVDASGKDLVFLETVGTGQSEVEVIGIADVVLLVLMPGSGDAVQALKAGIMEIPDVIAINKMDHPPTRCCRRCAPSSRSIPSASGVLGSCARRSGVKACPSCGTPWSRGGTSWPSAASSRNGGAGTCAARSKRSRSPASASSWSAVDDDGRIGELVEGVRRREVDPLTAVGAVVDAVLAGQPDERTADRR